MTFRTKFLLFVLICVPPNNPITACGATSFPGYHSFPKWAIFLQPVVSSVSFFAWRWIIVIARTSQFGAFEIDQNLIKDLKTFMYIKMSLIYMEINVIHMKTRFGTKVKKQLGSVLLKQM